MPVMRLDILFVRPGDRQGILTICERHKMGILLCDADEVFERVDFTCNGFGSKVVCEINELRRSHGGS